MNLNMELWSLIDLFFFNEQAQTVLISINKEGYTDEKPRKVPLKETKIQEQKTVQRAAQASHYPPTKLASCLAPAIPHALASSIFSPAVLKSKPRAGRRFLRSFPSKSPKLPAVGVI